MNRIYTFRPITHGDMAKLYEWLCTPHVSEWYDCAPLTLEYVAEKYGSYVDGTKPTLGFIIRINGLDAGYIQSYRVTDWESEYNVYIGADSKTVGIDLFIGEADYIHKGHGAGIMEAFIRDVAAVRYDAERFLIGPDINNRSAIRMYEKAGFVWWKTVLIPDEAAPEYLMLRERSVGKNP